MCNDYTVFVGYVLFGRLFTVRLTILNEQNQALGPAKELPLQTRSKCSCQGVRSIDIILMHNAQPSPTCSCMLLQYTRLNVNS
jgi:hypothetical protein